PSLIETAGYCLRGALDHWSRTGCNHLADINDIRAITERVNGGYNGYDERVAWFNKLWPQLRGEAPAESWKAALSSPSTMLLQEKLVQLGYDIKVDGRYGPKTTEAVTAYQKANGLKVDGIAGDITMASIAARLKATGPATGSAVAADPPGLATPIAGGLGAISIAEAGKQLTDQADALRGYAEFSSVIGYAAGVLMAIGVGIIAVGIVRTYIVPALRPAKAPVPE
ncbi:peptidoglycan-binding protein, partial [Starkeya nomas]